jgi:Xaa-Pro aminopeptidase
MRRLIALGFLCMSLAAQQIPLNEYRTRRTELRKSLGDAVFIAFGLDETAGDIRSGFFQSPDFYYLTGWNEPGAILVLTPKDEFLLIPRHNEQQEKWTGRKLAPGDPDVQQATGFQTVIPAETFESRLPEFLSEAERVYTLRPDLDKLRKLLPLRTVSDASLTVARMRSRKSPAEVDMIQYATDKTLDAHRAAWGMIKPGKYEYQVAAVMVGNYLSAGCARSAYAPIVGSGPNGAVLHYAKGNRRMDSGELLLMDVAAECDMYASDITRTVPVNGKFTPRQRELYEVVLGAQKAAIAAIKPGMTLAREGPNSLNTIAKEYLNKHGKDGKGEPLGKYFIHGLSHHVGLDVHDPSDPSLPLEAGMVITVEPGVYIPEEGIGIRIEDIVLVTEKGAKVLSAALPREADEVEKALAHSN